MESIETIMELRGGSGGGPRLMVELGLAGVALLCDQRYRVQSMHDQLWWTPISPLLNECDAVCHQSVHHLDNV